MSDIIADNRLVRMYEILFEAYGPQHWWPGDTPWEICVGAVLTQNTNWENVTRAINNLKRQDALCPHEILALPDSRVAAMIHPAGYYNLKTQRLKNVTKWWLENVVDDQLFPTLSLEDARESLLEVNGVGQETADSILLYCFNLPVFVIDSYTKRISSRHLGTDPEIKYEELQKLYTENLPENPTIYNEFHALLVHCAKHGCRKDACQPECPLCNGL